MEHIYSPLIPNGKTKEVEKFDTEKIRKQYQNLGTNVDRYFDQPYVRLMQCLGSGYRFYYPPSILGDAEFYKELSYKRKNYYSIRWEHNKSLEYIRKMDNVLEVGSGFGSFMLSLQERNIKCKGIEFNVDAVEQCKKRGLDVEGASIEDLTSQYYQVFDIVCSFQVLEHIYDVHSFIKSQLQTLKKGGKLIIGVPNNNPYLFVNDKYHTLNLPPHHAGLWNKCSLYSLEGNFNLKVESLVYEPFSLSYNFFINHHLNKIQHKKAKNFLKRIGKKYRSIGCRVLSLFFKGRNLLVIYKKL